MLTMLPMVIYFLFIFRFKDEHTIRHIKRDDDKGFLLIWCGLKVIFSLKSVVLEKDKYFFLVDAYFFQSFYHEK